MLSDEIRPLNPYVCLTVYECPDEELKVYIRKILNDFCENEECSEEYREEYLGECKEECNGECQEAIVEKLLKIVRQNDMYLRHSHYPIFQNLVNSITIKNIGGYLRKTWAEKRQFMFIADDISEYVKIDGNDLGEMEFICSISNSTIRLDNPDISSWVEEWSEGKDQHEEAALKNWVKDLPDKMQGMPRVYLT